MWRSRVRRGPQAGLIRGDAAAVKSTEASLEQSVSKLLKVSDTLEQDDMEGVPDKDWVRQNRVLVATVY